MSKRTAGSYIVAFLRLGKYTISFPVALTAFLGYFLHKPVLDGGAVYTVLGVFFLSMGSGAFNQIQERHTDSLMPRTKNRPIPSGMIPLSLAIVFSAATALLGTALLMLTGYPMAAAIGVFTMAWYNFVYTPLKRVTAFAVLPGALIGSLPPIIGWTAAGGYPLQTEIVFVGFFLFVGQMPHYWLLMIRVGSQFREAGLPVITSLFEPRQIRNLSFTWIAATGAIVMMLPATPIIRNWIISVILVLSSVLFLIRMFRLTFRGEIMNRWKTAFITVNLFYLLIILLLIADRII
jgi:protoheme IX farnesyltransferase